VNSVPPPVALAVCSCSCSCWSLAEVGWIGVCVCVSSVLLVVFVCGRSCLRVWVSCELCVVCVCVVLCVFVFLCVLVCGLS
jgi:hypothetical protein